MTTLAGKLLPVFRANVQAHLDRLGWDRKDLAAAMGVTRSYITQVLGGHRGVGLAAVDNFAEALEVEPVELLETTPKKRRRAS